MTDLHINLLTGDTGRNVNAAGAVLWTMLGLSGCVVWWPGIQSWRRSLTLRRNVGWKRFNWDLHSATGIWTSLFILMWGITGIYAAFPKPFRAIVDYFDPPNDEFYRLRFGDRLLRGSGLRGGLLFRYFCLVARESHLVRGWNISGPAVYNRSDHVVEQGASQEDPWGSEEFALLEGSDREGIREVVQCRNVAAAPLHDLDCGLIMPSSLPETGKKQGLPSLAKEGGEAPGWSVQVPTSRSDHRLCHQWFLQRFHGRAATPPQLRRESSAPRDVMSQVC
jgi:hypothetical protein